MAAPLLFKDAAPSDSSSTSASLQTPHQEARQHGKKPVPGLSLSGTAPAPERLPLHFPHRCGFTMVCPKAKEAISTDRTLRPKGAITCPRSPRYKVAEPGLNSGPRTHPSPVSLQNEAAFHMVQGLLLLPTDNTITSAFDFK